MSNSCLAACVKGSLVRISSLAVLCLSYLVVTSQLYAQSLSYSWAVHPPLSVTASSYVLEASVGTASQQVQNAAAVDIVFSCNGCTINEDSALNLEFRESWLNDPSQVEIQGIVSDSGHVLTLRVVSVDSSSFGGYGTMVELNRVIIEVEEIIGKNGPGASVELTEVRIQKSINPVIRVDILDRQINIQNPQPEGPFHLLLMDFSGRHIQQWMLEGEPVHQLLLPKLTDGPYILKWISPSSSGYHKFMVRF